MSEELLNQVIKLAHTRKHMTEIAREIGMGMTLLKYNLGKARRLEEVKALLKSNLKRFQ